MPFGSCQMQWLPRGQNENLFPSSPRLLHRVAECFKSKPLQKFRAEPRPTMRKVAEDIDVHSFNPYNQLLFDTKFGSFRERTGWRP